MNTRPEISVIIPLFNEQGSLAVLHEKLTTALGEIGRPYEILFIDDGSTDQSAGILDDLCGKDPQVGVVHFRRNFGKAAGLDAGFRRARGAILITMDADLQDEPAEIPRLLEAIEAGADVVSGWKRVRRDPLGKTLPSRLFNWAVSRTSGLKLHDFNCGLKAYRKETVEDLHLYGELHRYVPVLLFWRGFRVTEVTVQHNPRRHGRSKYGFERFARGFFDLLTVLLNTRYRARPLHLFGVVGALLGTIGFGVLSYLSVLWFMGLQPIGNRPLLFLGLLLVMVGIQLVSTGLLGELINSSQHSGQPSYTVRQFLPPRSNTEKASDGASLSRLARGP